MEQRISLVTLGVIDLARARANAIAARYHETHFMDWVPELKARYGLKLLGEP